MSMFADTTYAKTMTVAKKLLNVYGLRAEVIADNIANVSTPNFKRSDVTFEYQLARALDSEKYDGMEAKRTDSRHFPFHMYGFWRLNARFRRYSQRQSQTHYTNA